MILYVRFHSFSLSYGNSQHKYLIGSGSGLASNNGSKEFLNDIRVG